MDKKKSIGYRIGELLGITICCNLIVISIALTVKFIFWLLG